MTYKLGECKTVKEFEEATLHRMPEYNAFELLGSIDTTALWRSIEAARLAVVGMEKLDAS